MDINNLPESTNIIDHRYPSPFQFLNRIKWVYDEYGTDYTILYLKRDSIGKKDKVRLYSLIILIILIFGYLTYLLIKNKK